MNNNDRTQRDLHMGKETYTCEKKSTHVKRDLYKHFRNHSNEQQRHNTKRGGGQEQNFLLKKELWRGAGGGRGGRGGIFWGDL